jgi:hypothetical protein
VKPAGTYLHFEGTYRGVYRGGKVSSALGTHTFKEIDWVWLEVTPLTQLGSRNVQQERVLDFYFAPQLPKKSMFRLPGNQGTNVILVGPEKKAFAGTIYDVVMWQHTIGSSDAEITIKDPNGKAVAIDALEISGTIRFSIPDTTVVAPQPTLTNAVPPTHVAGTPFQPPVVNYAPPAAPAFSSPVAAPPLTTAAPASPGTASGCGGNIAAFLFALAILKWMPVIGIILIVGLIANAVGTKTPNGVNANGQKEKVGCFTMVLMLVAISTCVHSFMAAPRPIFYGVLFATLCLFVSRIQTRPIWRALIGIFFVLCMVGYWAQYFHFDWQRLFQSRKTEGRTTIEPPVPIEVTDKDGNKKIDSLFHHQIEWEDFSQHNYVGEYSTTLSQFEQSNRMHNALAGVEARGDVRTYWTSIYQSLARNDQTKLDSIVNYFQTQRDSLRLNPTETAEAVVTFIQEIPYYLLHDGTCEEAMSQGNDFLNEYHSEGKPCLAGVVAGLQSPYEFVHNLKGDCDTRSVLCHTILTKLGIPSSVWVSEAYGHSIIGIGVAGAGNNYKTVNGQRHFATELTAKGFRVGMISPDHTDMDNWLITITNP